MKVLITGHTGSLGKQLTQLLLDDNHQIIGYSRGELLQSQLPWKNKITQYLGDVRDSRRLMEAARGCEIIYHLAALKQVDKIEENPEEAIKTNIAGTESVLHAQRVLTGISRVVLSSTDKAVFPINSYGASKFLAERIVMRNPNNIVCRWGNVIASRGSVVPEFLKSIRDENVIRVTDRRCTRFWIKPETVAIFMYLQSQRHLGGLCIPDMKAYPVVKLGMLLGDMLNKKPNVIEIGLRPGEKIHESLRRDDEGGHLNSQDQSIWFTEKEMRTLLEEVIS